MTLRRRNRRQRQRQASTTSLSVQSSSRSRNNSRSSTGTTRSPNARGSGGAGGARGGAGGGGRLILTVNPHVATKVGFASGRNTSPLTSSGGVLGVVPRVIRPAPKPAPEPKRERPRRERRSRAPVPPLRLKREIVAQPTKNLTEDTLKLANLSLDGDNELIEEFVNGITYQRPEIVSLMKINPIYFDTSKNSKLNDLGQLMEINYQIGLLQDETIRNFNANMIKAFEGPKKNLIKKDIREEFEDLKEERKNEINNITDVLKFYANIDKAVDILRSNMSPKSMSDASYKTDNYYAIGEFFDKKLKFNDDQYNRFTRTKVYLQLLIDYKFAALYYSHELFDKTIKNREDDYSPTDLNNPSDLIDFRLNKFRSTDTLELASRTKFFKNFMRNLPSSAEERLIILFHFLGKELTVSKNLSSDNIDVYADFFGFEKFGNPFDNIIGDPGKSIFSTIKGENSLASLSRFSFPGNENAKILTFEDKVLDVGKNEIPHIPGWSYFTDTLYKIKNSTNPKFNKEDFRKFVDTFNSINNNAIESLNSLLALDKSSESEASRLYKTHYVLYGQSIELMDEEDKFSSLEQPLIVSLFNFANTDRTLKIFLFELCLLASLSEESLSKQGTIIFEKLASEYNNLKNFESIGEEAAGAESQGKNVNLTNNTTIIYSYWINLLIEKIADRIYNLTKVTKDSGNAGTFNSDSELRERATAQDSAKSSNGKGDHFYDFESLNNFTEKLKSIVNETTSASNNYTLLKAFIDSAKIISYIGSPESADNWLLEGKSRFNQLSVSTQLLMIFEIFSSLVQGFSHAELRPTTNKKTLQLTYNSIYAKYILRIVELITGQGFNKESANSYKPEEKKNIRAENSGELRVPTVVSPEIRNTRHQMGGELRTAEVASRHNGISTKLSSLNSYFFARAIGYTNNEGDLDTLKEMPAITRLTWDSSGKTNPLTGIKSVFTSNKWINSKHGSPGGVFLESIPSIDLFGFNPFQTPTTDTTIANNELARIKNQLINIGQKLEAEEGYLSNINYILKILRTRINSGFDEIDRQFNDVTLRRIVSNSFKLNNKDTNTATFNALKNLKNPAQLQNSVYAYLSYKDKFVRQAGEEFNNLAQRQNRSRRADYTRDVDKIFASESINTFERDALYKYAEIFSKPEGRNTYLLSVGLPRKFVNFLQDRADIKISKDPNITPSTFSRKQGDIIKINVYKRLLRFPDIIFQPRSFYFDASLFVLPEDLRVAQINDKTSLEKIYSKSTITDLSNLKESKNFGVDNYKPRKLKIDNITTDRSYNDLGLTNDEIREIAINHFNSHFLSLLLRMSTGMKITEDTFLDREIAEKSLNEKYVDIVLAYMRSVVEEPIPTEINGKTFVTIDDVLNLPDVSKESKELLNIIFKGNILYNQGHVTNKILGPKMFDRIFHLPVDMDDFIVDVDLTRSTTIGKNAFNQAIKQNILAKNSDDDYVFTGRSFNGSKDSDDSEVIFDDVFVSIESIV